MNQHTRTPRRSYRERMQRRRRIAAIGTLLALLLGLLVQAIDATGAFAHAGVVTIAPANGSVTANAPKTVSITFNEGVTAEAPRVQLLDAKASVVPARFTRSADGSSVTLTPNKALAGGMYALRWSVTSADGHVVTGASTFSVAVRGKTGKPVNVTANGSKGKTLAVRTTDGVGVKTFTVTGEKVTGLELRHKRLGATLEIPVAGGIASGVIPFAGEWTLTVIERVSTYSEERYTAKIAFK